MIEAMIIKGLTQVFQNLVMSELNDLTSDMVKEAVGQELDMEALEMLEEFIDELPKKISYNNR